MSFEGPKVGLSNSASSQGLHTHHPGETNKEEKSGLQKVIDLVNNKTANIGSNSGSSNIHGDMNRKLQAMLEETLTKNMHLQQVCCVLHIQLCAEVIVAFLSQPNSVAPSMNLITHISLKK